MAGYYDPNKDYSKELQRTDLTAAQRSQFETERANKIEEIYNGNEPTMYGSNQTYSQASAAGNTAAIQKAVSSAPSSSSSYTPSTSTFNGNTYTASTGALYGTPIYDSTVKNTKSADGVTYSVGADMSKKPELAGQTSISNGYTVFYDDNGYAYKAVKGVTDYTPSVDTNAANGTYNTSGAWTDNEMMTAADIQQVNAIRAQLQAGQINGDQANAAANSIRAKYGYVIDKSGNVTSLGTLTSVNNNRAQMGLAVNPENVYDQYYRYLMGTDTSAAAQQAGSIQSIQDFAAANGLSLDYTPTGSGLYAGDGPYAGSNASNPSSLYNQSFSAANGGLMDTNANGLKEIYANRIAADLANLKGAYDTSVNGYEAQLERLPQTYDAQRNRAAATRDVEQMNFDERAVANGLNSGVNGQAALSRSAAYQSALAGIGTAEANAIADIDLAKSNLQAQYESAIAKIQAEGNADLAEALREEYFTQMQLQAQAEQAAAQREAEAQAAAAAAQKPVLTAAQVLTAMGNGIKTDAVRQAYEYYYGTGGFDETAASLSKKSSGSSGGSSGGAASKKPTLTAAQARDAADSGINTDTVRQAYDYYYGAGAFDSIYGTGFTQDSSTYQSLGNYLPANNDQYLGSGVTPNRTSLSFDPSSGVFTWNGKNYSMSNDLVNAIDNANLTASEKQTLTKKFSLYGFDIVLE